MFRAEMRDTNYYHFAHLQIMILSQEYVSRGDLEHISGFETPLYMALIWGFR